MCISINAVNLEVLMMVLCSACKVFDEFQKLDDNYWKDREKYFLKLV